MISCPSFESRLAVGTRDRDALFLAGRVLEVRRDLRVHPIEKPREQEHQHRRQRNSSDAQSESCSITREVAQRKSHAVTFTPPAVSALDLCCEPAEHASPEFVPPQYGYLERRHDPILS
jgi:hypothetical protein